MRSATPKVLHTLAGRTMLAHVLTAAEQLVPEHLLVVVGHAREQVTATLGGSARAVVQQTQDGTGHAVRVALEGLEHLEGTVVVVLGDTPLLTAATLRRLVDAHEQAGAATTLLAARVADPLGYGRVVRDASGAVTAVVEHKDADEAARRIDEIATGVYAFSAGPLREALSQLSPDNVQGELYLTDVVGLQHVAGLVVSAEVAADANETRGINDRAQLAELATLLRDRLVRTHQLAGVAFLDPRTAWVDVDVQLEPDSTIGAGVQLHGRTVVRRGAVVGPDTTLTDCEVGEGASVVRSHCTGAVIGPAATVGPFSYLRPGTVLGRGAKAGAFVEIKASTVGDGSKVPHLSYVGDATIGEHSNIGAGTIVVNYDGVAKHRTSIGDGVRVGSNNSLVAPVELGDRAYTGADAVIRKDVPADALAYSENTQHVLEQWAQRKLNQGEHPT